MLQIRNLKDGNISERYYFLFFFALIRNVTLSVGHILTVSCVGVKENNEEAILLPTEVTGMHVMLLLYIFLQTQSTQESV